MKRDLDLEATDADGVPEQEPGVVARLIEYARGRMVALPPHTTLEIVENPQAVPIPGAAYYGYGLLSWQGRRLPMLDLDAMLRAYPQAQRTKAPRYALVVAYQRAPGQPVEHGAIGLADLPQNAMVRDEACCELPNDSDMWPHISLSCFRFEGRPVPIVDTARLFGSYHG